LDGFLTKIHWQQVEDMTTVWHAPGRASVGPLMRAFYQLNARISAYYIEWVG